MVDNAIISGKSLQEDSVKMYNGYKNSKFTNNVRRTNQEDQDWIKQADELFGDKKTETK